MTPAELIAWAAIREEEADHCEAKIDAKALGTTMRRNWEREIADLRLAARLARAWAAVEAHRTQQTGGYDWKWSSENELLGLHPDGQYETAMELVESWADRGGLTQEEEDGKAD